MPADPIINHLHAPAVHSEFRPQVGSRLFADRDHAPGPEDARPAQVGQVELLVAGETLRHPYKTEVVDGDHARRPRHQRQRIDQTMHQICPGRPHGRG